MEETLAVESAAGETASAQAPERKEETLEEVLSRHRLVLPSLCLLWIG
jgi:OTU domain-containing protein 6